MNTSRNIKAILLTLLTLLILSGTQGLWSQVWPGDTNNNGVVNAVDWLFLNYALGEVGPPRPFPEWGIEWEEKIIDSNWGSDFPGTTVDLVFADCDGDGEVTLGDHFAIDENFGLEHAPVEVDVAITGTSGVDPQLFMSEPPNEPLPETAIFQVDLSFGTQDIPVPVFTGLAFEVAFDPNAVLEIFYLPNGNDMDGWANYDLNTYQNVSTTEEGRISIAIGTSAMEEIENGSGLIGRLFVVIEDDVVGYSDPPVETEIYLENLILFGAELNSSPVVNDTINVLIINNSTTNTNQPLDPASVDIFPNPADDLVYLKSDLVIEEIIMYNMLGQVVQIFNSANFSLDKLDLTGEKPGQYFLKIHTPEGILTKKLLLH